MAFQKKDKSLVQDGRPKASALAMREAKVTHLIEVKTPEARRVLKQMNTKVYRGSRTNLANWYCPTGKKHSAK